MAFLKDKKTRTLIIIMSVLVAIALMISRSYYRSVNNSFDPRVVPARELYAEYNNLAVINDFEGIFQLLDSIENYYNQYPHYDDSFETGVVYNNRAAAYLTMAIHKDSMVIRSKYFDAMSKDTLFHLAEDAVKSAITIYENWMTLYNGKGEDQLDEILNRNFFIGLESYTEEEKEVFKNRRIEEIQTAQLETPRRLSVSYSNLGLIYRNYGDYEVALENYKKAIDLWDQNMDAKNNVNVLLGRPKEKRNLIQKMFPPQKEK